MHHILFLHYIAALFLYLLTVYIDPIYLSIFQKILRLNS